MKQKSLEFYKHHLAWARTEFFQTEMKNKILDKIWKQRIMRNRKISLKKVESYTIEDILFFNLPFEAILEDEKIFTRSMEEIVEDKKKVSIISF